MAAFHALLKISSQKKTAPLRQVMNRSQMGKQHTSLLTLLTTSNRLTYSDNFIDIFMIFISLVFLWRQYYFIFLQIFLHEEYGSLFIFIIHLCRSNPTIILLRINAIPKR